MGRIEREIDPGAGPRRAERIRVARPYSHAGPVYKGCATVYSVAYRSLNHGSAEFEYPRTSQNPLRSSARNSIFRIHFAPFHAYNLGVMMRHGPPCSRGSGR